MEPLLSLGWNAQLQSESLLPAFAALDPARVVAVDRDSLLVATSANDRPRRVSIAGRLRHQGTADIAVGDWVGLLGDRVDQVFTRKSCLVRKRAGPSSAAQVIAANVDWTLIAMSLNEDFSARRIERYVLASWDAGATPVVVLTKLDLVPEAGAAIEALHSAAAGCQILALSAVRGDGIEELRNIVGAGQCAVLVGSSGVGKSSLINALVGRDAQRVESTREGDDKGRHTTTRRELIVIPGSGGLLIDTPGMREFGVAVSEAEGDGLAQSFADIGDLSLRCGFSDCAHSGEPRCAVAEAIACGQLTEERLQSYRRLEREQAFNERRQDAGKLAAHRKVWKQRSMEQRARRSPKG